MNDILFALDLKGCCFSIELKMPCVTLLLAGFPRHAPLEDLSQYLDHLFDTDEIGTFTLRNLPNNPRTNKRQVALDFRSGFDAVAAQEKLDSCNPCEYEGRMYSLIAKINKIKEYARQSCSPERNVEVGNLEWPASETIPDVSYGNMYRAHAKLDAHLELLKKQKLILETEREILREKKRLKREYGCMEGRDSEHEATTSKSKRRRPRSRGCRSGSRHRRSRSRAHVDTKDRKRSRDPLVKNEHRTRHLRSRSKERRSLSHDMRVRDSRSRSRDSRDLRSLDRGKTARSQSRDRSDSNERIYLRRPCKDPESSREGHDRGRSQSNERRRDRRTVSQERIYGHQRRLSRERGRERRSMSKERDYGYHTLSRERVSRDRRSTSRSRYIERRSTERAVQIERAHNRRSESSNRMRVDDSPVLPHWDSRVQRSRTPDRRDPLAIMPNPVGSHAAREWSQDGANESPRINVTIFRNKDGNKINMVSPTVKNKQAASVPNENSKDFNRINDGGNETVDKTENQKENQEKNIFANSEIRKEELLQLKIESVTQNVKLLVLATLHEMILEDSITISESNKLLLEKTLEELVRERVEPLVRVRNEGDIGEVMRKYKLQYPKENEVLLIREILEFISKLNETPAVSSTNPINAADKASSDVADQSKEEQNCIEHENKNKDDGLREKTSLGSNLTSKERKESFENAMTVSSTNPAKAADKTSSDVAGQSTEEQNEKASSGSNLTSKEGKESFENPMTASTNPINAADYTSSNVAEQSMEEHCIEHENITDLNKDDETREKTSSGSNLTSKEGKESSEKPLTASTNPINAADKTSSDVADQSMEEQNIINHANIIGEKKDDELQEKTSSGSNLISKEGEGTSDNAKDSNADTPKNHTNNNDKNEDKFKTRENKKDVEEIADVMIIEPNEPIIIDVDSSQKAVPKNPKFYLVIKRLVRDMKRVIVKNNHSIQISVLECILRHTLMDLVKGQGYMSNKDIESKFRALHPKEKDNQFLKNVIKDINDGKYFKLTGPPTTDDCEDDVILIEPKYDVITVEDSDDDDANQTLSLITSGEHTATATIPKKPYLVNSGSKVTGSAYPVTSRTGPKKHGLANDNPTRRKPSNPGSSKNVPVSGSISLAPIESRPNPSLRNPAQMNAGLSNLGATKVPTNPSPYRSRWDLVNPGSLNLGSNELVHNPTPESVLPWSTLFRPAPDTSQLVTADPHTSNLWVVNPGSANHGSTAVRPASSTSKPVSAAPDTSKLRVVNHGSANLGSTAVRPAAGISKLVTAAPDTPKIRVVKPGSANLGSTAVRPAAGTSKLVTAVTDTSKRRLVNAGSANLGSPTVRQASGTSKRVTAAPYTSKGRGKIRVVNPGSNNLGTTSTAVRPASGTSKLLTAARDTSNLRVANSDSANLGSIAVRPGSRTSKLVAAASDTSKLRVVNPGFANHVFTAFRPASGTSKLVTSAPDTSKRQVVNPGSAKRVSTAVRPASGISKPISANPDTFQLRVVNPGSANLGSTVVRTASGTSKPVTAAPDTSKLRVVNPGSANLGTTAVRPTSGTSKLVTAAPDTSKLRVDNPWSANFGSTVIRTASGTSKPVTAAPDTSKLRVVNPGSANLGTTAVRPASGTSKLVTAIQDTSKLRVNPGSTNLDSIAVRPAPDTSKVGIVTPGSTNLSTPTVRPAPRTSKLVSTSLRSPAAPDTSNLRPVYAGPFELGPNPALATSKIQLVNPGLPTGTVKTVAQTTKKANAANTGIIANADGCMPHSKRKATEKDTKTVMNDTENVNHSDGTERNVENNSNSLKVTAITIMTSLNELTAITDRTIGPMELPIENVKEEMPSENSDKELTDLEDIKEEITFENSEQSDPYLKVGHVSTLTEMDNAQNAQDYPGKAIARNGENSSNNLKVTAITIMTSLTELTAIADKTTDRSKILVPSEDIKEELQFETPDTEQIDSAPKNKEGANNHQVNSICDQGIRRVVQENSNYTESSTYRKAKRSQKETTLDDEDETIESICKYVQSLLNQTTTQ